MATQADGKWPPNVNAVIITEEEKNARLQQAPPGGVPVVTHQQQTGASSVPGAPYAKVETRYVIPNEPVTGPHKADKLVNNPVGQDMTQDDRSQQTDQVNPETNVQEKQTTTQATVGKSEEIVGRAAIIAARKMGVDCVWTTTERQPVDLDTALALIDQDPESVYFDFDLAAEIPEPEDVEDFELENVTMATLPTPPPPRRQETIVAPEVSLEQKRQTVTDPVSERERLAWGGILSSPGQSVYFRPNVIRVEVEGKVTVQKGIQGNVRMLRVTRTEPGSSVQLANAVQTKVVPPLNQSPNPNAVYRNVMPQSDRIPVTKPVVKVPPPKVSVEVEESAELIEESEF